MSDAGEGLIDNDSKIQERMEEMQRERLKTVTREIRDPEQIRALESLKLARTELERQLAATKHERRRTQITQAIAEIDRRVASVKQAASSRP